MKLNKNVEWLKQFGLRHWIIISEDRSEVTDTNSDCNISSQMSFNTNLKPFTIEKREKLRKNKKLKCFKN